MSLVSRYWAVRNVFSIPLYIYSDTWEEIDKAHLKTNKNLQINSGRKHFQKKKIFFSTENF